MTKLFAKLLAKIGWLFAAFLHYSPPLVSRTIAWTLAIIWFDLVRFRRKIVLDNIANAYPDMDAKTRVQIGRKSIFNITLGVLEFSHFPFYSPLDFDRYFIDRGLANVDQALAKGKGALLLGLHLGNGDFAISGFASRGYPIYLISKQFKTKWFNDLWFGLRGRMGTRFISPEKSSFEILKALKKNCSVIFVLDQFMGPPIGIKTKFFGIETGTAAGLAIIAERTGAPVIPCYSYREGNGKHAVVFEAEIPFHEQGSRDETISHMTQVYTNKLEAIVRSHPEQWLWLHRRWKKFG